MRKQPLYITCFFVILTLLFSQIFALPASFGAGGIALFIDGNPAASYLFLEDDRLMVPLRLVGEQMGFTVSWEDGAATVNFGGTYGKSAVFTPGAKTALVTQMERDKLTGRDMFVYKNDEEIAPAPRMVAQTLYVPLYFLCQLSQKEASFNPQTGRADVVSRFFGRDTVMEIDAGGSGRRRLDFENQSQTMSGGAFYYLREKNLYRSADFAAEQLVKEGVDEYLAYQNRIYALSGQTLFVLDENGTSVKTVSGVKSFTVINGFLVYAAENGLYRANLNAENEVPLVVGEKATVLHLAEDKVYYIYDGGDLRVRDLNGENEKTLLAAEEFYSVQFADGFVYYWGRSQITYRMRPDGTGKELVYGLPLTYFGPKQPEGALSYFGYATGGRGYLYLGRPNGEGLFQVADAAMASFVQQDGVTAAGGLQTGLYRIDENQAVLLTNDPVSAILGVKNGKIYYLMQ